MTASDDFDALFDEAPVPGPDASLEPVTGLDISAFLRGLEIPPASGSSLAARGNLVELHATLQRIERVVSDRRRQIEQQFVLLAAETKADEIRTSQGIVKLKPGAASYEVKPQTMRRELERFIPTGSVSEEELNEACPVVVSYSVNHTKLNKLAKHRGEEVEKVIEANRTRVEPDPKFAKPVFPKPKEV